MKTNVKDTHKVSFLIYIKMITEAKALEQRGKAKNELLALLDIVKEDIDNEDYESALDSIHGLNVNVVSIVLMDILLEQ